MVVEQAIAGIHGITEGAWHKDRHRERDIETGSRMAVVSLDGWMDDWELVDGSVWMDAEKVTEFRMHSRV